MNAPAETVVLVHGLWMHGLVFCAQQHWLRAAGFAVRRFSYPSLRGGLDDNVGALAGYIRATRGDVVHLVGHSLGGLLVLQVLARHADARLGRVVLLGSPCAGSHCAATLAGTPLLTSLVGRTMQDWQRAARPILPPAVEIGVIAGTCSVGLGRLIPGLAQPNDGAVAVAETALPEAKEHIVLHVSHSGMLVSHACAVQTAHFLRTGRFVDA
jgi:pimeloyl-ACP methyl ester carboxylesterase